MTPQDRFDISRFKVPLLLMATFWVIAVAPAYQGQGFGGKLLRALIEKSERTGTPLYLETESNVRMYEHLGFTVVKEIVLPIVNLPMWEMTRGG